MTSRVLVAIRVNAAPDRAFAVFSGEIGAWWRPHALFATTPRPPGRLAFEPGPRGRLVETFEDGREYEIGRMLEWSPPHRLRFEWRPAFIAPEQATEVIVTFELAGPDQTRVIVEHLGWDRVPQDNAARHGFPLPATLARTADWWRAELASFKVKL